MTRQQYIRNTLTAICGTRPASPSVYHFVERMADQAAAVYTFDKENER